MIRPSKEQRPLRIAADGSGPSRRVVEDRASVAAIMADPTFAACRDLLTAGVAPQVVHVATAGLPAGEATGRAEWTKPANQDALDADKVLATHLLAGDRREAVSLEGYDRHRVRAVALSYRADALISRMTIGLQAGVSGHGPADVVSRLAQQVGPNRLLVTSAGGRAGSCYCHFRIPTMMLSEAQGLLSALLTRVGFAPMEGVIEILPATVPSRLPFGLGGRMIFADRQLDLGTAWRWQPLVECLQDLVPLDFAPSRSPKARPRAAVTPRPTEAARADAGGIGVTAIQDDPAFATYLQLVAPGAALIAVQPGGGPTPGEAGGWAWTTVSRATPRKLSAAVVAHLLAAQTRAAARLAGCDVNAVGLSYRCDATVCRMTIDLDGRHGYDPAEIVRRLAARVGRDRLLVTSSSGRAGRYHCHVRIPPMRLDEAQGALRALLAAVGIEVCSGGTEVYPATSNCRLPFGRGGCYLFADLELKVGVETPWQKLTARLLAQSVLDLTPPSRRESGALAVFSRPKPSRARGLAAVEPRAETEAEAVRRWWKEGVRPHERDRALFALLRDCQRRHLSRAAAVSKMQRWIDEGGLDRSAARLESGGIAWQRDVNVPRIAEWVYAHPSRCPRVPLTAREVGRLVKIAEARCPDVVGEAVLVMLDVLPLFKGADLRGLDGVRIHERLWTKTLGHREYESMRHALGLFVRGAPHSAGEHSTTWHLFPGAFPFEPTHPSRHLVVTSRRTTTRQKVAPEAPAPAEGGSPKTIRRTLTRILAKAREVAASAADDPR